MTRNIKIKILDEMHEHKGEKGLTSRMISDKASRVLKPPDTDEGMQFDGSFKCASVVRRKKRLRKAKAGNQLGFLLLAVPF